ncbi:hypothetical protein EUCA11A_18900 [Eubacterium callanderi]|nr:hypothetical protein EUCA2A_18900 [Eubacterium callanderi]WPK72016.1 hypothetical protein EUCA11A_18900 [Eubacterium callanderi]
MSIMTKEEVIERYPKKLPPLIAARLLEKSYVFVTKGLQEGRFPWGYAVKTSKRWDYYINTHQFLNAISDSINYIDRKVLDAGVYGTSKTK